ncbi:MAG: serine hydrolase [Chitinophagaceae bacterium]
MPQKIKSLFFLLLVSCIITQVKSQQQKFWTVTGPDEPALNKLDAFMKSYMQQFDIKAGALAIAKDGKIVYAKGYTYAEQGYPVTMPTNLFRIASVSKPITSLEIHRLANDGKLNLDSPIQKYLNLPLPAQSAKPGVLKTPGYYFSKVTVRNLLAHQGGWNRDANGSNDPTFLHDQDIANAMNNGKLPVSKPQLVAWGAKQLQQMYPGTEYHYSNFGYLLLGMIIEKLDGKSYIAAVKANLLSPLGIERPTQSYPKESQLRTKEVHYHVIPADIRACMISTGNCPVQYGGENNTNFDSFGGWILSPIDYVKLFASFRKKISPAPDLPPGNLITIPMNSKLSTKGMVFDHGGLLPGTWSYMAYRMDGVDLMIVWNTTNAKPNFTYENVTYGVGNYPTIVHKILDDVSTWPSYDLSPAYFGKTAVNILTDKILYDGVWNSSNSKSYYERAKKTDEFTALYSKYYKINYKLLTQQTYTINGTIVHDGVWVPGKEGQFAAWDKSPEQFQQLYDEWWKKGYRLIHQEAYVLNGKLVYNGIWNPNTGGQFVTWDKTLAQFNALNVEMIKKGFHLVQQQNYTLNGNKLYNGIWNPGTVQHFTAHEQTRDQFSQLFNEQFNKGYRLIQIQSYHQNGQLFYDGIWAPGTYGQYISWGKNNEWIDAQNIICDAKKLQPLSFSAY